MLVLVLSWIIGLTAPLLVVVGQEISGRDLILIAGGLFLIWKSTAEIHQSLEGEAGHSSGAVKATFAAVIVQIMVVDMGTSGFNALESISGLSPRQDGRS